jgi:hypothetical protein
MVANGDVCLRPFVLRLPGVCGCGFVYRNPYASLALDGERLSRRRQKEGLHRTYDPGRMLRLIKDVQPATGDRRPSTEGPLGDHPIIVASAP